VLAPRDRDDDEKRCTCTSARGDDLADDDRGRLMGEDIWRWIRKPEITEWIRQTSSQQRRRPGCSTVYQAVPSFDDVVLRKAAAMKH